MFSLPEDRFSITEHTPCPFSAAVIQDLRAGSTPAVWTQTQKQILTWQAVIAVSAAAEQEKDPDPAATSAVVALAATSTAASVAVAEREVLG